MIGDAPHNQERDDSTPAEAALKSGNFREALDLFRKATPGSCDGALLLRIGVCQMNLGLLADAVVSLAAASFLHGGAKAPALLASVQLELGDFAGALRSAKVALQRDPRIGIAQQVMDNPEVQRLSREQS
ncbi:MAG: hypothetical protein K1X53_02700 [Candidatus Sumerlaeaceae bacterium]|nr:hypothetical protein [Candidatus Sumerlaeaceae bacterium]